MGTRRARGGGYFVDAKTRATKKRERERERELLGAPPAREESVLVFIVILNYGYNLIKLTFNYYTLFSAMVAC